MRPLVSLNCVQGILTLPASAESPSVPLVQATCFFLEDGLFSQEAPVVFSGISFLAPITSHGAFIRALSTAQFDDFPFRSSLSPKSCKLFAVSSLFLSLPFFFSL